MLLFFSHIARWVVSMPEGCPCDGWWWLCSYSNQHWPRFAHVFCFKISSAQTLRMDQLMNSWLHEKLRGGRPQKYLLVCKCHLLRWMQELKRFKKHQKAVNLIYVNMLQCSLGCQWRWILSHLYPFVSICIHLYPFVSMCPGVPQTSTDQDKLTQVLPTLVS